ncbi:MAG: hypothetical protein Q9183_003163 [Haloplaca sp. 2 TL-2023]
MDAELGKDVFALLMASLSEIAERVCCLSRDYEEDFRETKFAAILDFLADFDLFLALIVFASENGFEESAIEHIKGARQLMVDRLEKNTSIPPPPPLERCPSDRLEKDTSNPPDPQDQPASDKDLDDPSQRPREQRDDTPLRQPGESWLARRFRRIFR